MPRCVWFGSVKLVFVKVWLGLALRGEEGALWLERRAVNLVNFLCCGQVLYGFAASPTSLDTRVVKAKISWRCFQISWKCSREAVGGLMFAFTNLYNLAIDRSIDLSSPSIYISASACVCCLSKSSLPSLLSLNSLHNLYTYVVGFLIKFLFERQDPAGRRFFNFSAIFGTFEEFAFTSRTGTFARPIPKKMKAWKGLHRESLGIAAHWCHFHSRSCAVSSSTEASPIAGDEESLESSLTAAWLLFMLCAHHARPVYFR